MHIKLGVVSDAPAKKHGAALVISLHHLFDAVVTFEDTSMRKPNPEPFRKILDMLQIQAIRKQSWWAIGQSAM